MEEKNSKKKERKMRDSGIPWIVEVPEGWGMSPLKYNYNILAGATPDSTKQNFWDGNIKWITPADYKTKDVYVSFGKRNLTSAGYKACSTHMLPKGSIVISKRAPIGSVAITTSDLCTNQGCLGLVAKNKFVNNKYFYYVLSIYDDVLNLYGSGTTFKEISANVFSNIEFPSPSVTIQNSIADFLDSKCSEIDALIENLRARMESVKEYKKAVITEAVTKGLDKDAKMKDSGVEWIGEVPEGWKICKVKQISNKITDGAHISPNTTNGEFKFLSVTNMNDTGALDFVNCLKINSVQYAYLVKTGCQPKKDDVLISKDGTIGKTTVVSDNNFVVASSLVIIRPNQLKIRPKYLKYCLMSNIVQEQLLSVLAGSALKRVSIEKNANLKFVYTYDMTTQQQIIDYLDSKCSEIDTLLQNYEDQIATLEEYKKSLIYEYVTGKKEVPEA